jgi:hypothetical protein
MKNKVIDLEKKVDEFIANAQQEVRGGASSHPLKHFNTKDEKCFNTEGTDY